MCKPILIIICISIFILSCSRIGEQTDDKESKWELVWEENFEKDDFLDPEKWNVIQRNRADWGNYMSDHPDCMKIKDGELYLRGIVNDDLSKDTAQFLTGGVDTKDKFTFQYGKIEVRAKLENATGAWPAIWMLGENTKYGGWPDNGEIDLMEHLNYEDRVFQTVHSYYTVEMKKTEPKKFSVAEVETEDFVNYGMEWYPDSMVFFVNDKKNFTYPKVKDADQRQWPFDHPFYLLIDMQLGGSWVGKVKPEELPVQMIVDWVKVYKEKD